MIIDSHAHYARRSFNDSFRFLSFDGDSFRIREGSRAVILDEMKKAGIAASVEPGVELESNAAVLELCRQYPDFLFPAVGVHPTRVPPLKWKDRKKLTGYSRNQQIVAIGETGLDFHLERKEQHRIKQMIWFQFQINLAHRMNLPLILHIREAHRTAVRMLRVNRKKLHGGVAHCFCGSPAEAAELTALGFAIGIGGTLLQQNNRSCALQETVRSTPMEKIIVETDAPFVLPFFEDGTTGKKAKRKIRNTSLILPGIIRKIAELKAADEAAVESAVFRNTAEIFGLGSRMKRTGR